MPDKYVRWFRVLRCTVCGFPFSDKHHLYPQAAGGSQSDLIPLCPNHHRSAHMLYAMVDAGATDDYIRQFAEKYFDRVFVTTLLDQLVRNYRETKDAVRLARYALSRWLVKAALSKVYDDLGNQNP